ncbi:hypothetical protein B0H13DRAFT_1925431, partial [Mycena leptocephala]
MAPGRRQRVKTKLKRSEYEQDAEGVTNYHGTWGHDDDGDDMDGPGTQNHWDASKTFYGGQEDHDDIIMGSGIDAHYEQDFDDQESVELEMKDTSSVSAGEEFDPRDYAHHEQDFDDHENDLDGREGVEFEMQDTSSVSAGEEFDPRDYAHHDQDSDDESSLERRWDDQESDLDGRRSDFDSQEGVELEMQDTSHHEQDFDDQESVELEMQDTSSVSVGEEFDPRDYAHHERHWDDQESVELEMPGDTIMGFSIDTQNYDDYEQPGQDWLDNQERIDDEGDIVGNEREELRSAQRTHSDMSLDCEGPDGNSVRSRFMPHWQEETATTSIQPEVYLDRKSGLELSCYAGKTGRRIAPAAVPKSACFTIRTNPSCSAATPGSPTTKPCSAPSETGSAAATLGSPTAKPYSASSATGGGFHRINARLLRRPLTTVVPSSLLQNREVFPPIDLRSLQFSGPVMSFSWLIFHVVLAGLLIKPNTLPLEQREWLAMICDAEKVDLGPPRPCTSADRWVVLEKQNDEGFTTEDNTSPPRAESRGNPIDLLTTNAGGPTRSIVYAPDDVSRTKSAHCGIRIDLLATNAGGPTRSIVYAPDDVLPCGPSRRAVVRQTTSPCFRLLSSSQASLVDILIFWNFAGSRTSGNGQLLTYFLILDLTAFLQQEERNGFDPTLKEGLTRCRPRVFLVIQGQSLVLLVGSEPPALRSREYRTLLGEQGDNRLGAQSVLLTTFCLADQVGALWCNPIDLLTTNAGGPTRSIVYAPDDVSRTKLAHCGIRIDLLATNAGGPTRSIVYAPDDVLSCGPSRRAVLVLLTTFCLADQVGALWQSRRSVETRARQPTRGIVSDFFVRPKLIFYYSGASGLHSLWVQNFAGSRTSGNGQLLTYFLILAGRERNGFNLTLKEGLTRCRPVSWPDLMSARVLLFRASRLHSLWVQNFAGSRTSGNGHAHPRRRFPQSLTPFFLAFVLAPTVFTHDTANAGFVIVDSHCMRVGVAEQQKNIIERGNKLRRKLLTRMDAQALDDLRHELLIRTYLYKDRFARGVKANTRRSRRSKKESAVGGSLSSGTKGTGGAGEAAQENGMGEHPAAVGDGGRAGNAARAVADPECKKWLMKKGPEARRNAKKAGEEARLAKDEFISMERAAMGVLPEEEEYLAALPEEKRCGGGRAAGPAKTPSAVASARPPRVVKRRCTADSDSRPCSFSTESRAPQRLGPSARTSLRPSCTPVNAPAPVRAASAAAHRLPPLPPLRPTRARAVTPKPEREHLPPTVPHPHHRPVRPHGFEGRGGWGGWLRCGRAGTSSRTPRGVQRVRGMVEGRAGVPKRLRVGLHRGQRARGWSMTEAKTDVIPNAGIRDSRGAAGGRGLHPGRAGSAPRGAEGGGMVEVRAGGDFIPNAAFWLRGVRGIVGRGHPERGRSGFERRRWRDIEGAGGRSQTPAVGLRRAQKARGWPMTKVKTDVIQNAGFGIRKAQQAGGRRGRNGQGMPQEHGRVDVGGVRWSVVPLRPLALGLGTSFLLDFVPFRLRARCTLTMPKAQQEPGRRERRRRRELAAITRIRDPIEQCLAHIATPRHKDHGGELYTVFRIERVFCERLQLEIDKLEVKTGYSMTHSAASSSTVKIVRGSNLYGVTKRLVHLTLRARGAAIAPYPCPGCGVKHREFYLDAAAGGIDGVCEVIEFWLGALGQAIDRVNKRTQSVCITNGRGRFEIMTMLINASDTVMGFLYRQHAGFYQYGSYMDYDGQNFGTRSERLKIPPFDGSLHIAGLSFAPLEMRTRKDEIRAALMKRGKRFQTMRGQCHGEYTGVAIEEDEEKDKKFS